MDKLPAALGHRVKPQHAEDPLRIVYLGDSLTAGTQDGVTIGSRQVHGYAQVVSRALGVAPNGAYISEGGIPLDPFVRNSLDSASLDAKQALLTKVITPLVLWTWYLCAPPIVPPIWRLAGQGGRTEESKDSKHRPQNNFAVPSFKARDILYATGDKSILNDVHTGLVDTGAVGQEVALAKAILQNGGGFSHGTEVDRAVKAKPDIVMLWGGANDTLHALHAGYIDDATLTPLEDKQYTYRVHNPVTKEVSTRTSPEVMPGFKTMWTGKGGILPRLLHETDAQIFVATIPQVTVTPSMATIGQKIGPLPYRVLLTDGTDVTSTIEEWTIPTTINGPGKDGRTEFPPGSKVGLFRVLLKFIDNIPVRREDDLKTAMSHAQEVGMLSEDEVADPDELAAVERQTKAFNTLFHQEAAKHPDRIHVIEANASLAQINQTGVQLRGNGPDVRVTGTFTGVQRDGMEGIFSFDGLHPSDTGHAVVGNNVLESMKQALAGNPRYDAVAKAQLVDEKAAFAQDPHRSKQMCVVLERQRLEALNRSAVV